MLKAQTGRNQLSVVIADHQTAGKGREQRQWISEKEVIAFDVCTI